MLNEMNLERIRDHFIICGYGQVGRTVIEQLIARDSLRTDRNDRGSVPAVVAGRRAGDPGRCEAPHRAANRGIARAAGICYRHRYDADNLYITVTAKSLNPN